MTVDRPAAQFWAKADEERLDARAVQEANWQNRMAKAGGIAPEALSEQGRRILVWLTKWDNWTVDGVIELLSAAREAGHRDAAALQPTTVARAEARRSRLDTLAQRVDSPELGL